MARCKSGRHEWTRAEDAERCCNGYKRVLLLGADVREASTLGHGTLEGATPYGFAWMKLEPEGEQAVEAGG